MTKVINDKIIGVKKHRKKRCFSLERRKYITPMIKGQNKIIENNQGKVNKLWGDKKKDIETIKDNKNEKPI